MRSLIVLLLCLVTSTAYGAGASANVLSSSPGFDGGVLTIIPTIDALLSVGSPPMSTDYDTVSPPWIDLTNAGAITICKLPTYPACTSVNHQPYGIAVYPVAFTDTPAPFDKGIWISGGSVNYVYLANANGVASLATPKNMSIATPMQLPASAVATTSTNSGDGTGNNSWGLEITLTSGFMGQNTGTDSQVSGIMGGILASLENNHATLNAFDLHGVMRQSSANWPKYDHTNYGYGIFNWATANAISGTGGVYLQPPNLNIVNVGYYIQVNVYPFATTRRDHEVVYVCTAGYPWPTNQNEYSAATVAAGCTGSPIYTDGSGSGTTTFYWSPAMSGNATIIAFTTDGAGNFSAVQEWQPQVESFLIGTSCTK